MRPDFDLTVTQFATRKKALNAYRMLRDLANSRGYATLYDLKTLPSHYGPPPVDSDKKWGWRSMDAADVREIGRRFYIFLPQPSPII